MQSKDASSPSQLRSASLLRLRYAPLRMLAPLLAPNVNCTQREIILDNSLSAVLQSSRSFTVNHMEG
jgi:hypothetical protein